MYYLFPAFSRGNAFHTKQDKPVEVSLKYLHYKYLTENFQSSD